jgi:signal transduction histidine kinase
MLVAGIVLALVTALASAGRLDPVLIVQDLAAGLILIGAGIVAWDLRPHSRVGLLVAATGFAWLAGSLVPAALYLHRGLLTFLLLSYPTGRLSDRLSVIEVGAACLYGALLPIAPSELATLAFAVLLPVLAVGRMRRATGPIRRGRASAAAASVVFGLMLAAGSLGRLSGVDIRGPVLLAYELVVTTMCLGLVADLVWGRWSQAAVIELVIELGEQAETGTLRDRLAQALGDPSLVVGYWIEESGSYVDDTGRSFELPGRDSGRRFTAIDDGSDRVGVLVHDVAIGDDPVLVASVAAAARLALGIAQLQVQIRSRMAELVASRRRIMEAADSQRRRLEEDLSAGALSRLERVERIVAGLRTDAAPQLAAALATAEAEVRAAQIDLRDLIHETDPTALRAGGLSVALQELAMRAPVRVVVRAPNEHYVPLLEATVYFVCSEALTNVAKHARASTVTIDLTPEGGWLRLAITDDGAGGADSTRGSGLRGLADRIGALGGTFAVRSDPGGGTSLAARLPLDQPGRDSTASGLAAPAPIPEAGPGLP